MSPLHKAAGVGGGDGDEAGSKHTVGRRVGPNGKVLRGREMRGVGESRGGGICRKSVVAAPVPRHTSAPV